ncbi:hypothetical protein HC891_19365, partial [Candidatus Gracilibacteria bacterium]|nr:hypothetical protein [Candidatus Gracilibacteria bacterium]
ARLVGYAHAAVDPQYMGIGPVPAVRRLFDATGLSVNDIDVFEVNEAFAAQALAVIRDLELPPEKTNPNGSGISLGHPIGATGCILTVKAIYELQRTGGRYALVTMCIGGGQGIAAVFERLGGTKEQRNGRTEERKNGGTEEQGNGLKLIDKRSFVL